MGQMLSAIGVIISIIYLAAQIRIQTRKAENTGTPTNSAALIDRHIKTAKPTLYRLYLTGNGFAVRCGSST